MKLFNRNPVTEAAWEITKKQYPEWDAPITSIEGISEEEKYEEINYSESNPKSNK